MNVSRRQLLKLALGAAQVGLLSQFGMLRTARGDGNKVGPTRLLTIHVNGGLHWESFFSPLTRNGITKFIPEPTGALIPWGYSPSQVENFDHTAADLDSTSTTRKLRGPIYWDWNKPDEAAAPLASSNGTQNCRPYGYVWADPAFKLYEKAALLVGADQNTASHGSGIVASMSGIAGATFRSPAVQAVVANAMAARFPDRPLPSVSLGGTAPTAFGLPALANPTALTTMLSAESTLTDRRDSSWAGLRERTDIPNVGFDGTDLGGVVPATVVDRAIFDAVRAKRGISTVGSDQMLEQLYDTYKGASKTIARDILSVLGKTKGFENIISNPKYPKEWTACVGSADACGGMNSMGPYDFALQLLKSNLVTSVSMRVSSIANFTFDTHQAKGPQYHANHLHIALEQVGRLIVEMSLTPSPDGGGRTLLDDTIVYVYSDFGRTFPKQGSDHHPATCAIIAGGGIIGNQMMGGYDETMEGSPMGVPVNLINEGGQRESRTPRSQDVVATVLSAFYLEGGKDFFIPGGFGTFEGVIQPAS